MNKDRLSLISIVVPVYKVERYLDECVESLLAQTYPETEIILVDDGSPDGCPAICDGYASRYDNIRVVHKSNGGLSSARNAGIDAATGEYLMFVDSDDVILPEMAQELYDAISNADAQIAGSSLVSFGNTRKLTKMLPEYTEFSGDEALCAMLDRRIDQSSCTKIYLKSAVGDTRFPEGVTNEDFPFLACLYRKCDKVVYLPKGYYLYRLTPGSITYSFTPSYFDILHNMENVAPLMDNAELEKSYKACLMRTHIDMAYKIVRNKKKSEFRNNYVKSRDFVRKNVFGIMFSPKINIRYKVKAILGQIM